MALDIDIKSNKGEVLSSLEEAKALILERLGLQAESFAKSNCPVDTGNLRNSITHQIQDNEVYIGTNVKYGKYIEFGTGTHAETGGRQTPWSYQDGKGNWHHTSGAKPHPFLRPAIYDHTAEYKAIIKDGLKGQ